MVNAFLVCPTGRFPDSKKQFIVKKTQEVLIFFYEFSSGVNKHSDSHLPPKFLEFLTKWKMPLIFPRKPLFIVHLTEKHKIEIPQDSPLVRNKKTISRFHCHIKVLYIFQTGILDKINPETCKKI